MKYKSIFTLMLLIVSVAVFAGGGQEGGGELVLWTGYPEHVPRYEAAAEAYMAENPDVTIEISSFKLRDSEQKYAIDLNAGIAPDIFSTSHAFASKFIGEGLLASAVDQSWVRSNFKSGTYEPFTSGGTIYAVPEFGGYQMLYYNKDHYAEAGLSAPPTTLDELMSHARALAKYDDNGNLVRSGISLRISGGGSGVAEKFDIFLFANGGRVMEPSSGGNWRAAFNNDAGYEALNFYLQALHKYNVDSFTVKHDGDAFVSDLTSQFNRETWIIGHAATNAPNMNYGITKVVGGTDSATNFVSVGLVIPETSENKELATDFIKFLNQDVYNVAMLQDTGWVPSKTGVDFSPVYADKPHFAEAIAAGELDYIALPPAASQAEVYTKFSARIIEALERPELVDDRAAIMSFLADLETEVNDIISGYDEF